MGNTNTQESDHMRFWKTELSKVGPILRDTNMQKGDHMRFWKTAYTTKKLAPCGRGYTNT